MERKWVLYRNFVILSVVDGILTWYLIRSGIGQEGNPVFNWFGGNWWLMAFFKLAIIAGIGAIISVEKDDYEGQKKAFPALLVITGVVFWNLYVLISA